MFDAPGLHCQAIEQKHEHTENIMKIFNKIRDKTYKSPYSLFLLMCGRSGHRLESGLFTGSTHDFGEMTGRPEPVGDEPFRT